jgi:hypothetical protein
VLRQRSRPRSRPGVTRYARPANSRLRLTSRTGAPVSIARSTMSATVRRRPDPRRREPRALAVAGDESNSRTAWRPRPAHPRAPERAVRRLGGPGGPERVRRRPGPPDPCSGVPFGPALSGRPLLGRPLGSAGSALVGRPVDPRDLPGVIG